MPSPLLRALTSPIGRTLALVFALVGLAVPAGAQAAGTWSDVFAYPGVRHTSAPSGSTSGVVRAVVPDGRGGVYVGGTFDAVDGRPAASVAHWDGAAWRALGGGVRGGYASAVGDVYDLIVAGDGSLYVTGRFGEALQADGRAVRANGLARWTGSAWAPVAGGLTATGSPDYAYGFALAEGPDGAIYVGGVFDGVVGATGQTVPAYGLARWRAGQWDTVGGLGLPQNTVTALDVRPDGALAVAGSALDLGANGGYLQVGIVEPDGTRRTVFDRVQGIEALAWDGDDLLIGGAFVEYVGGETLANLARWSGGQLAPVAGGTNGRVRGLRPTGGGSVFVVGGFSEVLGTATVATVEARGVALWTGEAWVGLGSVSPADRYGGYSVSDIANTPGGLVVGGSFDGIGAPGEPARSAASVAVYRNGTGWGPLSTYSGGAAVGPQTTEVVYVASQVAVSVSAPAPCGRGVLVGGTFGSVGGVPTASVAVWDGASWETIPGALVFDYTYTGGVTALASAGCAGGRPQFFVGGTFLAVERADGSRVETRGVAYWDGEAWQAVDGAPQGEVRALAWDGQTLAAGGSLQTNYQLGVYTWRPGQGWRMLGGGVDGSVSALTYGPDGLLYVGGDFATVRQPSGLSIGVRGLARWTGAAWDWIGNPVYGEVRALAFGPDGTLYAGGTFAEFAQPSRPNTPARSVAMWDGVLWADGGDPGVPVSALAVGAGGRLYAGAANDPYGYDPAGPALSVFTETGWQSLDVQGGGVSTLTLDGTHLYVGGRFTQAGSTPSAYLARYDDPQATPTGGRPEATALAVSVAPNPVRGSARLTVGVAEAGPVRVAILDALGRNVATLWDGTRPAGDLVLTLDAARLPAGVYVVRAEMGGTVVARTVTVVR